MVKYRYNSEYNITKVSDNKGITAEYTHDAAGNILTCSRSDGTQSSYEYDENDNLTQKKVEGKKTVYEYDIKNRLRSVSQGGQLLMATIYDGDGNNVQLCFTPTRTKIYNRVSSSLL